jgi:hypothetical protein
MRRFGRLLTKREGGALVIELPVFKKSRHAMSMNIRVTLEDPVVHVIHYSRRTVLFLCRASSSETV